MVNIDSHGQVDIFLNAGHGMLYAWNSLSHLLTSSSSYRLPLQLVDWAEKDWRGLSIDVSRHFLPIPLLKRTLDGMEYSKFNVLHLHLTDAQSFPILLEDTLPYFNMTHLGLYGHHNTSGTYSMNDMQKLYTKQNLKDLVQYARDRGIEVVPEIDVPAHALSWGNALSELVVQCHSAALHTSTQLSS